MNTKRIERMTEDEQRTWWKENHHLVGIPSEVSTCQVRGKTTPSNIEGHTLEWWRFDSRVDWNEDEERWQARERDFRWSKSQGRWIDTKETPLERKTKRFQRLERGTPHAKSPRTLLTPAFDFGHEPTLTREERFLASGAKRQALKEIETHRHLTDKTVELGMNVPRHMWWDKERGSHATRRAIGVIVHMADAYPSNTSPDGLVPDTRFTELVALEDLRALLRSYVTDKEMDSLEEKAFGGAVKDRHTLARARRKASKAFD